ncbi:MAG TPA: XdhC family protein [Thermomicrobiales bacterium]|nr:XdhC family protein [Thermomicrobiales bacterium]
MSEWLPEIDEWKRDGKQVALATVTKIEGSAPRPVGARLAVTQDGEMAGSVSGGCVENAVVLEAQQALKSGTPRLLRYGISDEMAWDVGLACGGTIEVFVEPMEAPE